MVYHGYIISIKIHLLIQEIKNQKQEKDKLVDN